MERLSNAPLNGIVISTTSQIKIRAINIPGATATGTYNVALTATDTGSGGKTKYLNVDLQVNRVSSEWELNFKKQSQPATFKNSQRGRLTFTGRLRFCGVFAIM